MKKLPNIYQVQNVHPKNNNKKQCVVGIETDDTEPQEQLINSLFSGLGYSFNIPLIIKTKETEKTTSLIGKTKDAIITIDNEIIPLTEILNIKRKKNW